MTRRGRKRRLVWEDEYWKLIIDGMPTVEACRQIGIGRKTGYRWRAEAGSLPPARVAEETRVIALPVSVGAPAHRDAA